MAIVQVVGQHPGWGKTSLIGALLSRIEAKGRRAAYYKPFSPSPSDDPDVAFVARHLLSPESGGAVLPPQPLPGADAGRGAVETALGGDMAGALAHLEQGEGVVLVEGPDLALPWGGETSLAQEVAALADSRVLLLLRYSADLDADSIARAAAAFSHRLAGVIINSVPVYRRHEVRQDLAEGLRSRGIPYLGAVPEDRAMLSVTVEQIAQHLGGRWVQEPVNTDGWIHHFLLGANVMDHSQEYLNRYQDQALIVRAQRPDLQLASLMTDTSFLILTGGADPIEYVRVEALQRDVPLMVVDDDTLGTAEALGRLLQEEQPLSVQKARRFGQLVREHLDVAALDAALGL